MLRVASCVPRLPLRRICLSKMSTKAALICPKFIPVEHHEITSTGFKFRLVSYNILAQAYAKSEQFPHSPSPCRKWKTRSQAILTLLKNLGADFLCLQEVDEYDTFYKVNMETLGYASIYVQRSGKKLDGCGIFYKKNNAELVLDEKIEYNDLAECIEDETTLHVDKYNDTLASGSKEIEPKEAICFQIYSRKMPMDFVEIPMILVDPDWADVKLAQAKYLLSRLAQFKTLVAEKFQCTPSVMVAGDFNSTPGDKVYEYMISGSSSMGSPNCVEDVPMGLCSVYAFTRGEPAFTNCTPGFTGTLDYIFFSPLGDVKPVSYLQLPELESPDVIGGLPNYHHPSDHLPIGVEFEVI
ncbi:carbon catabolite repressor protein 4 homolog 4 isoform X3 [Diospyros lotus]|uniref:carbon catabolite repressor protein 4 homolog 4 isoform X3 n=1 Tax=Diospyros lotus TaxID=55363 RepID=UPI002258A439|nr:carbon catabolite repressor protein 4 homolog 4 isoform X3 [Diospyros lotus]